MGRSGHVGSPGGWATGAGRLSHRGCCGQGRLQCIPLALVAVGLPFFGFWFRWWWGWRGLVVGEASTGSGVRQHVPAVVPVGCGDAALAVCAVREGRVGPSGVWQLVPVASGFGGKDASLALLDGEVIVRLRGGSAVARVGGLCVIGLLGSRRLAGGGFTGPGMLVRGGGWG